MATNKFWVVNFEKKDGLRLIFGYSLVQVKAQQDENKGPDKNGYGQQLS